MKCDLTWNKYEFYWNPMFKCGIIMFCSRFFFTKLLYFGLANRSIFDTNHYKNHLTKIRIIVALITNPFSFGGFFPRFDLLILLKWYLPIKFLKIKPQSTEVINAGGYDKENVQLTGILHANLISLKSHRKHLRNRFHLTQLIISHIHTRCVQRS